MKMAIRFQGPNGPVVFECTRRDYPASFELPALIRKHAQHLDPPPAAALEPVLFLNREVKRAEDLLAVDAGEAKVVCAKIGEGEMPPAPDGSVIIGMPKATP